MLTSNMVGGSYGFSELLKRDKQNKKTKKSKKKRGDPSKLGYHSNKTNLNIIMKGEDGNLYKNKKYKKTKRWAKVRARVRSKKK